MADDVLSTATPSLSNIDLDAAYAVVEWVAADGSAQFLCSDTPDVSRRLTCHIHVDATSRAASFRLQMPVGLKAYPNAKTPFYFYIPAGRIESLAYELPEKVPDAAKRDLDGTTSCLQFTLTGHGDLVVPPGSLVPSGRKHGEKMDLFKFLARQTRVNIYLKRRALSEDVLRSLCDAIAQRSLKSIDTASALAGLYKGAGGRVFEEEPVVTSAAPVPSSPPSYDELAPTPPRYSSKSEAGPSKKRRRGSSSSADNTEDSDAVVTTKTMMHTLMTQFQQEHRAYLQEFKASLSEELRKMKAEVIEHLDERLKEIEERYCDKDDVDEQIEQHVESFDDVIDVRIDDRVTGIKVELEDFVDGEVAGIEERVLQRIRAANWTVSLDE